MIDLAQGFAQLDKQMEHNRVCPDGNCLDRDDCYDGAPIVESADA